MRPTDAGDWLLSVPEFRREMRVHEGTSRELWGCHLVRKAAAIAGDTQLVNNGLELLRERGLLIRVRYMPHMPGVCQQPLSPVFSGNNEHGTNHWKWVFRVPGLAFAAWREPARRARLRLCITLTRLEDWELTHGSMPGQVFRMLSEGTWSGILKWTQRVRSWRTGDWGLWPAAALLEAAK